MPARRLQGGHALAETLVMAAVLVPVLLLIPMIGKYQDLRHAVQMAGRSVAFDATLHHDRSTGWTPLDRLAEEVRVRHFANGDGTVRSGQRVPQGPHWARSLWTDPLGQPLLPSPESVRVGYGPAAVPDPRAGFTGASDGRAFNLNPAAGTDRLGLEANGILTGRVVVSVARLPAGVRAWEPFDRLDLTMTAGTSLLIDGWTARSPQEVEQRVGALVPGSGPMADAAMSLGGFGVRALELGRLPPPRLGDLEMWRDVVPADRLRGRTAP